MSLVPQLQTEREKQVIAEGKYRRAQNGRQRQTVRRIVQEAQQIEHVPDFLAVKIAASRDS